VLRASLLIALGWILIAGIAGFSHAFGITLMLPATSVILLCHIAFDRERSLAAGMTLALILGYLEDLHQGLPTGTLTLAFSLVYLALSWLSLRLAVSGLVVRALTALIACFAVDLLTWGILIALADPLGISREGLRSGLAMIHWHALATMLAAPAVWGMIAQVDAFVRKRRRLGKSANTTTQLPFRS